MAAAEPKQSVDVVPEQTTAVVSPSGAQGASAEDWPQPVLAAKEPTTPKESIVGFAMAPTVHKRERRDPVMIERANLLNMAKLIVKELIDSSLSHGRMLDNEHVPLQQFFVVLEHVLRHGLRPKKSILRDKREFWAVLESVERFSPEAAEINNSVRDMPNVKTALGRARAWLRLALMQKKLADYFRLLIDKKEEIMHEYYDDGAIMVEEEGTVISGLLVGLNVIDCNLCIKEEDLDQPLGVIDFSLYLRDNKLNGLVPEENESGEGASNLATILDQKNYLEELNRHLNATVTNIQQKLESTSTNNALMKEDLAICKNQILMIQEQNDELLAASDGAQEEHKRQIELTKQDIDIERATYQTSRAGLDNMYAEVQKKLQEETQVRLETEKELHLQMSMKLETEMAFRLMEKDIHEKQDTVISLRKQLEDIKEINLEMYQKLQVCDGSLKHKTELVSKLEDKTNQLVSTMKTMETRLKQSDADKLAAEEVSRKLGQVTAEKESKRSALETDVRIEREWRGTLQKQLEQEKERSSQIQHELQQSKEVEKEYVALKVKHMQIQKACEEQERTLAELGSHLSESKMRVEDMRETQLVLKEAQWTSDKDANTCKGCEKQFSVSRRKHHCRQCGDIYCAECSDNKMPHPSSSKPVRVCDACNEILLQRYSAQ